jgi:uncharacterized membrane protein YphA (DoxX/SURF4 family)
MMLVRRAARPLLAAIFVSAGIDTIRNPGPRVPVARDVASSIAKRVPALEGRSTEELIRINGAVQTTAGSLFALGRVPRLSALVLAGTLVPTTAAGHRYWTLDDPVQRKMQKVHFLKNLSILGGLLLAVADTEGKPGLAWRTHHTAEHAGDAVRRTRRQVRRAAKRAREKLPPG